MVTTNSRRARPQKVLTNLTQGFSCTAVILGGQTLTNVSNGKLPLEASIVLVGFVALILCFVGYNGELRSTGTVLSK